MRRSRTCAVLRKVPPEERSKFRNAESWGAVGDALGRETLLGVRSRATDDQAGDFLARDVRVLDGLEVDPDGGVSDVRPDGRVACEVNVLAAVDVLDDVVSSVKRDGVFLPVLLRQASV